MIMPASNPSDDVPMLPAVPWGDFFKAECDREGISTGEQFKERHPDRHRAIIQLLSGGIGVLKIRDLTGAHPRTIMAIRDANAAAIEMGKQMLAKKLRYIGTLMADSIAEDIEAGKAKDWSPQQRAIIMAISTDKAQLLEGSPTSIVQQAEHAGPTHDDFLRRFSQARRVQAEPATGLPVGQSSPKETATPAAGAADQAQAAAARPVDPDQVIPPGAGQSDMQSGGDA